MSTPKLHVLGIDHGNGETKTVHTVFHSGVRNIVGDSFIKSKKFLIIYSFVIFTSKQAISFIKPL